MTEDFEKSEPVEPEAEIPSPFDEPIAPPPLPEDVIEKAVPEVEAIAPPPLPEAYPETEVLGVPPVVPAFEAPPLPPEPEPEPATPPAHQPVTLGSPPAVAAPSPRLVDVSPAEEAAPKKSNQTLIIVLIVVAVLLFLCCCCVLPIGWVLLNLEDIMYELQYLMLF